MKKGFTLIELLVVISIISLLTSIVLSSLSDAKAKARDTAKIRALQEVRTALQMYFSDNGGYPKAWRRVDDDGKINGVSGGVLQLDTKLINYIKSIGPNINYVGLLSDGTTYCPGTTTCPKYWLGVKLELRSNSILSTDSDGIPNGIGGPSLQGTKDNCLTTGSLPPVGQPDLCYDITSE